MILLVVNFEVKDGKKDAFLALMNPLVAGSQAEEGNIEYDLYADTEHPNGFVLIEKWKDQAALDFHGTTDHYRNNASKLGELCNKTELRRFVPN